ncbi:MAG: acyl carrier protein [Geodermatophilaceae bacterium]|nr:acyl carrier protein [Geodermatophilaceae bacterium]
MSQPVTAETVRADAARHLGIGAEQLVPGVLLGEDLGLDSLAGIELSMSLEERYGINITDDELSEVTTYGHLEQLVLAKVAAS